MRYNLILSFCSLLFLSIAAVFEVNYLDYSSPVPYANWQQINFYSFKALKKPGLTLFGVAEFAFIKTNREVRFINDSEIEITSYFHPSRSYVFDQQIRNPGLLRHELYHFQLTEYISRLFRKEIADHSQAASHSLVRSLEDQYWEMEKNMQMQYDDDSYHSYVLKEQKRWESYIDSGLVSLHNYNDPVVSLKNK